jgi:cysteine desulfurase/selenocysteine lyase
MPAHNMEKKMNQAIRELFPVTQEKIYLDTAYVSPYALPVIQASQQYLEDRKAGNSGRVEDWMGVLQTAREKLASIIGASRDEIALTTNTTEGTNIVANMLDLKPGDNIVWDEMDHSTNKLVWTNLAERKGAECRIVKSKAGTTSFEDYERVVDRRTRVISISLVTHNSGYRYDLEAMANLAHANGAFLHVDAAQAAGSIQIDAHQSGVDFLTAGTYKWLLGPAGLAFFYIRSDLIPQLEPLYRGWMQIDSEETSELSDQRYKDARKYQTATINFHGVSELIAALEILHSMGMAAVEAHNLKLRSLLWQGLADLGLEMYTPAGARSGIVTCRLDESSELDRYLVEQGVIVTERNNLVRFSAHIFNNEDDIHAAVEAVRQFLGS